MLSPQYLQECLDYDSETGVLTWKTRPHSHFKEGKKTSSHQAAIWNAKFSGKVAFSSVGSHGYFTSSLSGKRMTGHRVAWAVHHGKWPEGEIDHINGDRTDNRIANLRDVPRADNAKNLTVKSGKDRGVYWYEPTSRWTAKIHHGGKMFHLGYFKVKSDARAARLTAEMRLGFHENHGRSA